MITTMNKTSLYELKILVSIHSEEDDIYTPEEKSNIFPAICS